jgi:SAM-dependent methyltransferase
MTDELIQHWDAWNREWRFRDQLDPFMERQRQVAADAAHRLELHAATILEVGCGTGWLSHALRDFGRILAVDLSPASIEEGRRRHPGIELRCGDFLSMDVGGPFDFVVSADSLAHMQDYDRFFERIESLVKPGGAFLLMTQNPFVWRRRSRTRHPTAHLKNARPPDWPSRKMIERNLGRAFDVLAISSIDPGGDTGVIWWVENRYVRKGMSLLVGRERWRNLLERAGLGRELVYLARRRPISG